MKISTKGRYGLRLMTDLAVYHDQGLIPLKEIAARQEISEKYLEQIMMQLNRSGLVRSVRGAQGGYMLAKTPEDITVGGRGGGLPPDGAVRHHRRMDPAERGRGERGGSHDPRRPRGGVPAQEPARLQHLTARRRYTEEWLCVPVPSLSASAPAIPAAARWPRLSFAAPLTNGDGRIYW